MQSTDTSAKRDSSIPLLPQELYAATNYSVSKCTHNVDFLNQKETEVLREWIWITYVGTEKKNPYRIWHARNWIHLSPVTLAAITILVAKRILNTYISS